jgi:hypothetical protein
MAKMRFDGCWRAKYNFESGWTNCERPEKPSDCLMARMSSMNASTRFLSEAGEAKG